MKKLLIIIYVLLLSTKANCQESYYQSTGSSAYTASSSLPVWYQCLQKYWFYRYRLVNDFTYIGANPGESLIAYRRTKGDVKVLSSTHAFVSGANCLDFAADQTIDLGHYLGMLAVEYRLLHNNNMNTDRTLYEIYYAQNAFDRLRYNSEYYYIHMNNYTGNGYPPAYAAPLDITLGSAYTVSSGFFVRDDVPLWNFLSNNNSINVSHNQHFNRPYLVNSFTCANACYPGTYTPLPSGSGCPAPPPPAPDGTPASLIKSVNNCGRGQGGAFFNYTGPNPPGSTYPNPSSGGSWIPGTLSTYPNCESQDQLADIFVGEALLSKYLDPSDPTALTYRERAQNSLFSVVDWVSHPCGPALFPFYSIPAPATTGGTSTDCAKLNCGSSGIIVPMAVPMAAAANLYASNPSATAAYMAYLDQPIIPPLYPYWWWFEYYQTLTPNCGTVNGITGLEAIEFTDDYASFADDWSKLILSGYSAYLGGGFYSPYSLLWFSDYISFLSNSYSHSVTWSTLKNHALNDYHGTLHLPIIWQLNNTDEDSDPQWHAANQYIEALLSDAPVCGTYNYESSQFNYLTTGFENYWNSGNSAYPAIISPPLDYISMWSGNDLLSDPEHRQGNACYGGPTGQNNEGSDCDFNGLDYMFLFSLYALERGNGYLQGMMNSYYDDNFNVPFPDSHGYGSTTNKLKLCFLEYMRYTGTISPGAWIDFRGAKKIDLVPTASAGIHIPQGSTVMIHIKDYNCSGGDLGDGPYNFAELNPSPADYRSRDSMTADTGWRQIVYLPNGGGFIPENIPPADPSDMIVDSFMNAPGVKDSLAKLCKYMIINSTKDTAMLSVIKELMGWNDDSIAAYTIPVPDSISVTISPNPTQGVSYLSYQISTPKLISIKLFNNLGQDMSYLIEHYDAEEQPGNYKLLINSDKLVPGMYYVIIQAGTKTVSKKLSVIQQW